MSVLLDEYTDAALRGDRAGAVELARDFAGRDASSLRVVTQLLAPSQRNVGVRWLRGECTVAEEHSATFVTESVLSSLAVGLEPKEPAGTVVMVCAEGEMHSLPARMATELMTSEGWRVIHLGSAMPVAKLRYYLAEIDADVVGVSVTLATNLPGAARTVRAARQAGYSVICGGGAFDSSGSRARAIGAHGQPGDLTEPLVLDEVFWGEPRAIDMDADWAQLEVTAGGSRARCPVVAGNRGLRRPCALGDVARTVHCRPRRDRCCRRCRNSLRGSDDRRRPAHLARGATDGRRHTGRDGTTLIRRRRCSRRQAGAGRIGALHLTTLI